MMKGSTAAAGRIVALGLLAGGAPAARSAIRQPTDLAGCRLWLDAADAAAVVQAGNPGFVEQWSDKSGNGLHVTQATVANQPATGVRALGGWNVLTFDGVDDWLAGAAVLAAGDDDFTYFAVWRSRKTTGSQVVFEQSEAPLARGTRASLLSVGGAYGFNGELNDAHTLIPFAADVWRLTGLVVDGNAGVNGNVHVFDNGNAEVLGNIDITVQNLGATGTRVGAKLTNNGENLDGDVAEIVVYDRVLPDNERNDVLYYLQQKWALAMGVSPTPRNLLVFDFEDGNLPADWTKTGTAFDTQPTRSSRRAFAESGVWFVGTFENDKSGNQGWQGDEVVGTLTSPSLRLAGNTIRARVGGGHQVTAGAECQLRLEVEAAPGAWVFARKETGAYSDTLREYLWNVGDLMGRNVRFVVLDNHAGGWGIVNVDYIRIAEEPRLRSFYTDFAGPRLDPALGVYRPFNDPRVALTGTGTLAIDTSTSVPGAADNYDLWFVNRAPRVRLPVDPALPFTLETRITARSYAGIGNHAGLVLDFADKDAVTADAVMFGPYMEAGLRVEGPTFGAAINALSGAVNSVALRIDRRNDTYTFLYSEDGLSWTSAGSRALPGRTLLYVGLLAKGWVNTASPVVEFDYLRFQTLETGTVLVVR